MTIFDRVCFKWALLFIILLASSVCVSSDAWASAWTLKRGQLWTKVTMMAQSTNEEYVAVGGSGREPDLSRIYEPGDRARYRENGQYDSRAVFFDVFYGITDRVDVGVQVPFFRQEFENVGFRPPTVASGFSDVRGFVKVNLMQRPFVGTLKLGVKAPTGKFENQDGIIPVGEGQWDFDVIAQVGRSFWPLPVYIHLDMGYRLRLKNSTIDRDPGDEWLFRAEAGYQPHTQLLFALKAEGIYGKAATVFNLKLLRDVKHVTYIAPTFVIEPYQGVMLETSLRLSAGGRNFPAGKMWVVGVSWTGRLKRESSF